MSIGAHARDPKLDGWSSDRIRKHLSNMKPHVLWHKNSRFASFRSACTRVARHSRFDDAVSVAVRPALVT